LLPLRIAPFLFNEMMWVCLCKKRKIPCNSLYKKFG
jgi:hypothetical protein